jgi:hypothetical protein
MQEVLADPNWAGGPTDADLPGEKVNVVAAAVPLGTRGPRQGGGLGGELLRSVAPEGERVNGKVPGVV